MNEISARILAIESIAERMSDAHALARQLSSLPIDDVEIVPAVYWRDPGAAANFLEARPHVQLSQGYLARCRQGQLCATLSHIRMWEKLLAGSAAGMLVFEDDMQITDEAAFEAILREIPQHPAIDFLRLHLFKTFRDEILATSEDELFVDDPSKWGFAGYYLSRAGAEKLLQRFRLIDENVDLVIPRMNLAGELNCKTVRQVVTEHHAFTGTRADLEQRHELERRHDKLQKSASTIWTSDRLFDDEPLHRQLSGLADRHVQELRERGYTTLRSVFDAATVESCRKQVMKNEALLKNTRPAASARHLAGFHRFPELETMHSQLAGNAVIRRFLGYLSEGKPVQSIGLSDITVNRSQCWHKDLLRGRFSQYLDEGSIWGEQGGGVYKLLLYLQPGSGLKLVRGSHLEPVSLDADIFSEPRDLRRVDSPEIAIGDVVVMDIRMSHRGASEEQYLSGLYDDNPRILISTAVGVTSKPLTRAMEIGNFHRLQDWMERNP